MKRTTTRKKMSVKDAKVKKVVRDLLKEYGEEVLWTEEREKRDIVVKPMQAESINILTARGGLPEGRIIEISGKESSGKTTTCYQAMKSVQEAGGTVGLIDAENSVDPVYLERCGVQTNEHLIIAQPDYGEQGLSILEEMIESGVVDLIVVDSVAALIPKAELEGTMTDQQVGLQARMMSKNLRRITSILRGSKAVVIFVNQVRDKIGGGGFGFGPQTGTPGGWALKHFCTIRITTRKTVDLKKGSKQIGFISELRCLKNKVGRPGRRVNVPIIFGSGINSNMDLILLAIQARVIRKRADMLYLVVSRGKTKYLGKGWESAFDKIAKSAKLKAFVLAKIREFYSSGAGDDTKS